MSEYQVKIGGDFRELLNGFTQLEARAQQSGQKIGQGLSEGVQGFSNRSLAALNAELNRLQSRQTRVDVNSAAFDKAAAKIREIQDLISQVERKKLLLNADPTSVVAFRARLAELNSELERVAVGSQRFRELQREIRGVEREFQRAGQTATRSFSPQSLAALNAELNRLQGRQTRVAVDSSAFEKTSRQIREVERQIQAVERRRIGLNADPGSIAALRFQLDQLNGALAQTAIGGRRFRELQKEIQGVERELRRAGEAGGVAAKGIDIARGALSLLGGISVGAAITGFLRSSIAEAMNLETATRRLSNTLGPQGAGQALGFLKGVSDQLGLSFRSLVGSYGRFTAAATAANVPIKQQQDLFTAVSRAGMALGLSGDEVNGAFLALQQIASKGVVSMEELRQQLGERLPIALSATARGLGLSQRELIKLVETGQLSSNKFFPAFTKGLNELTAGAGGVPTAAQNLQRFQNEWQSLQASLGQSLLPTVTNQVNTLTASLQGISIASKGRDLGFAVSGMNAITTAAAQVVTELDRVQRKYSLTDQQARNIFGQAEAATGNTRLPFFGALKEDGPTIEGLLKNIEPLARKFREGQKDLIGQANAEAAATQALITRLEEEAKARRTLIGLAGQRGQIDALQTEAALVGQITAGRITQADADRVTGAIRLKTLQEELNGYDQLISKLKEAKVSGANNSKELLAAESERAAKALELAKAQQSASQAEVQRRQEILSLERQRMEVASTRIDLETQAGAQLKARLQTQRDYLDAMVGLQGAQSQLTASQFGLESARQNAAIAGAERALQLMRERGAGIGAVAQQEQLIASLRRGAEMIEQRALAAQIQSAAQRFQLERQVLAFKQAQAVIDAQAAQAAARRNVLEQQSRMLELRGQAMDPSLTAEQRNLLDQRIALQRQSVALAQQQARDEASRVPVLAAIQGIERQTLAAQQQATANTLRTEAANKGLEQSLRGPLGQLDAAATASQQIGAAMQTVTAGTITAGGQTIVLKANVAAVEQSTQASASAALTLADGFNAANASAIKLLGTLQRVAAIRPGRWAGGPVEAGASYQVNELGQESLLSPSGILSLIHAPARSIWRAPASGTVIPAGITAGLKAAGVFGGAGRGVVSGGGAVGAGKLEQAIDRLSARMDALVAKRWDVRVATPSSAGLLRAVGGF